MDCCISPRTPNIEALPNMLNTPRGFMASPRGFKASPRVTTPRSQMASVGLHSTPRRANPPAELSNIGFLSTLRSIPRPQVHKTPESERNIYARRRSQSLVVAVANTESRVSKSNGVGTPHEPSSPEGKLLSMILQKENHFFEFAVSEQLDELVSARDQAAELKNQTSNSMQSILQKRIAEVKEKERQTAVEDVMYMSIVHKFSEVELPMVPKLSECVSNNTLEIWPSKCRELESIHSLEVQEMIREHVMNILRMKGKFNSMNGETTTKMDKIHIGRLYASSIMYGYFLKAACSRRQLDSSIARTPAALHPVCHGVPSSATESYSGGFTSVGSLGHLINTMCLESPRLEKLSSYVKTLDSDSLQRCAKLKSREAINLIEKHTWALFGDEKIGDDNMDVTFTSLERLVLEAVAFGSFLWDVESSVDSVYELTKN
ncbi:hypothetical protein ACHQM5_028015 [Ranunculus cassubicifolius]